MTLPVYIATELEAEKLRPGAEVEVRGSEAHHAATVRRTRSGERIQLVNGRGLRTTITVSAVDKATLRGTVSEVERDFPHAPQIVLVQALAKGGRDEQAIETATEYGVDAVKPWQADRSVARWEGAAKIARGIARWEATVREAAKQSRRSWLPQVGECVRSDALTSWIHKHSEAGDLVLVCHETAQRPMVHVLQQWVVAHSAALRAQVEREPQAPEPCANAGSHPTATPRVNVGLCTTAEPHADVTVAERADDFSVVSEPAVGEPVTISEPAAVGEPATISEPAAAGRELAAAPTVVLIVGPEGGISEAEISRFAAAGAVPVLLGEHVMRASSAGPWAIAVIRAQCAQ
ncbi:MAG: RsmE family RNA methyltransferase [Arcanobacterium sp.]|nr:RsmE family RNA methyltransferase [Arcanobacterium sp.]